MSIELWRTRPYSNPISQVIDRLFEQTFVPYATTGVADGGSTGFQSLPVNVWELDDAYYVALLAPGLDEKTIDVTFHDDTLAIEGTLTFQASEGAKVVWQEFNPGPARFRRSLRLGAFVDASKVEAMYRDGLLVLTMPKAEHAKPRQIHVSVTSGDTDTK
jgi:HSP20 family protein